MIFEPVLAIFVVLIFFFVLYLLARPIVNGATYFPTKRRDIETMKRLAGAKPSERLIDLGSGDGRIIMAFARDGIEAHGYEINPLLVLFSRWKIHRAGLQKKAFIHWKSFWRVNLAPFDILTVYIMPRLIPSLEKKISREMKPGARIISNVYKFNGLKLVGNENKIYSYTR